MLECYSDGSSVSAFPKEPVSKGREVTHTRAKHICVFHPLLHTELRRETLICAGRGPGGQAAKALTQQKCKNAFDSTTLALLQCKKHNKQCCSLISQSKETSGQTEFVYLCSRPSKARALTFSWRKKYITPQPTLTGLFLVELQEKYAHKSAQLQERFKY